jgi:hypothetical protein
MINNACLTAQSPKLISSCQVYTRFSRSFTSNQVLLFVWPAERSFMGFIAMADQQPKRFRFFGRIVENVFGRRSGSRFPEIAKPTRFPSDAGLLQFINLIKPLHDSTTPRIQHSRHNQHPTAATASATPTAANAATAAAAATTTTTTPPTTTTTAAAAVRNASP